MDIEHEEGQVVELWMTRQGICEAMGVSHRTLNRRVKAGAVERREVDGAPRFRVATPFGEGRQSGVVRHATSKSPVVARLAIVPPQVADTELADARHDGEVDGAPTRGEGRQVARQNGEPRHFSINTDDGEGRHSGECDGEARQVARVEEKNVGPVAVDGEGSGEALSMVLELAHKALDARDQADDEAERLRRAAQHQTQRTHALELELAAERVRTQQAQARTEMAIAIAKDATVSRWTSGRRLCALRERLETLR